jgi:hypothetical protein
MYNFQSKLFLAPRVHLVEIHEVQKHFIIIIIIIIIIILNH